MGVGGNILFSKYRKQNESLMNSSLVIPLTTLFFGLFCAVVNFSYLGNLSHQLSIPIEHLPISGSDLAFVTYPAALDLLPFPNFWAIIFFLMLVTLGIDTQFTFNEQVSYYVYKYYLKERGYTKEHSSITICVINTIVGCIFIFDGGYYIFLIFDENVTLFSAFVVCLAESLIAGYVIGEENLQNLSQQMTDQSIPKYFIHCYMYYCPIIFSGFILMAFYEILAGEGESYKIVWPYILKFFLCVTPTVVIIYYYFKHKDDKESHDNEKELDKVGIDEIEN